MLEESVKEDSEQPTSDTARLQEEMSSLPHPVYLFSIHLLSHAFQKVLQHHMFSQSVFPLTMCLPLLEGDEGGVRRELTDETPALWSSLRLCMFSHWGAENAEGVCWFIHVHSLKNSNKLDKTVKLCRKITGAINDLQRLYEVRVLCKVQTIVLDPQQPILVSPMRNKA
ncbi:hypothetical protein PAMP_020488 [Pampus punctatissimus]